MTDTVSALAGKALKNLHARGVGLALAESLTGGLLASTLVDVPGASQVFLGGIVAYATDAKRALLGVESSVLEEFGAVSKEAASAMALGVREAFASVGVTEGKASIWGLATTGVAGPDSQEGKPAGQVYLALATDLSLHVKQLTLTGDRAEIRAQVVEQALLLVLEQTRA